MKILPAVSSALLTSLAVAVGCGSPPAATSGPADAAAATDGAASARKRVFVTSSSFDGNLGGVAGADGKCLVSAVAAGLGGDWKAWISDANVDARDRLADVGPYYLVDRETEVFASKAALSADPLAPIALDERGRRIDAATFVWTGTRPDGAKLPERCGDWTSSVTTGAIGCPLGTGVMNFSSCNESPCDRFGAIYCFEQ